MKKGLSLILILTMFASFLLGCGNVDSNGSGSSVVPSPVETAEPEKTAALSMDEPTASENSTVEDSKQEEDPSVLRVEYDLPLFDETRTISYWSICQGMDESKGSYLFWQRLAEETGVQVEFVDANEENAAERYNLMMATGDLTDIIEEKGLTTGTSSKSPYTGGYTQAIADGMYMDLTEIIPESCPNYWSLLEENESVYRDLALDDGTLYCFAMIYDQPYGPEQGAWVRTDMMNEAGITEIPTTETGWLELWKAMKAENVVEQPTRASNLGDLYPNIAEAYGTTASSSFLVDLQTGEVFYDLISDNYRDYLEFFRQVYSEGLVSSDFYSVSETSMMDIDSGLIATYECVLGAANQMTANGLQMAACPAVHLEDYEVAQPKLIDYETWSSRIKTGTWCCINANTENLEAVLRWLDFLYSDYGIRVSNYGFDEGVSYEYVDGQIQLTPAMLDRDENMIVGRMQYTMKEGPSYMYAQIEMPVSSEFLVESYNTWCDFDREAALYSTMPTGVNLDESENEIVASLMSDIETYVSTTTMQWMTCATDLTDESWNAYVSYIEDSGISDIIAAYQSAYDRYLTK